MSRLIQNFYRNYCNNLMHNYLKYHRGFLKIGPFPASFWFIIVFSIQLTEGDYNIRWLQDSNRGPLLSEATALTIMRQRHLEASNEDKCNSKFATLFILVGMTSLLKNLSFDLCINSKLCKDELNCLRRQWPLWEYNWIGS